MTGTQARETAADRVRLWAQELLEELLPLQSERGTPVLLACDDETMRVVGERLGHEGTEAAACFANDVKLVFRIDQATGLGRVLAGPFRQAPRPRPLPDFFPVLCLLVLAASRMAPDERGATHAYYPRLRELLGMSGRGELAHIEFVPRLFDGFADWLASDLEGARGRPLLPGQPWPPYVGTIVSQTVFRRRDRQVLSGFFSDRARAGLEGYDPLRRLRRWPGRHDLTAHALQLLDDDAVAEQVRAAIMAAYRSWDGSVLVEMPGGVGRHWPARLHLLPHPLRLHLGAQNTKKVVFRLDGLPVMLDPGSEVEVSFSLLEQARSRALVLGDPRSSSGALRLPALGDVVLFELAPEGLLRVEHPSVETVWVLTRERELQARFAQQRFRENVLPERWQLLRDVAVSELPGIDRVAAPHAAEKEFRVEGGLPLERGVYLAGRGPVLAAGEIDAEERLPVLVNGEPKATIGSGERIRLLGEPGSHRVAVGEEWEACYDVEERGAPRAYGALAHLLAGERALRSGARPRVEGDGGTSVCGATFSVPYGRDLPILTRVSAELQTIDGEGELARHRRPPTPAWLGKVGFGETVRWEIVRDGVVWLLCARPSFGSPWVQLQRDGMPERLTAEAATLVLAVAERGARVSSRRGGDLPAEDAWRSLVALARRSV